MCEKLLVCLNHWADKQGREVYANGGGGLTVAPLCAGYATGSVAINISHEYNVPATMQHWLQLSCLAKPLKRVLTVPAVLSLLSAVIRSIQNIWLFKQWEYTGPSSSIEIQVQISLLWTVPKRSTLHCIVGCYKNCLHPHTGLLALWCWFLQNSLHLICWFVIIFMLHSTQRQSASPVTHR